MMRIDAEDRTVDAKLGQVIENYLLLIEDSKSISAISIAPLFLLYWKTFVWEFSLFIASLVVTIIWPVQFVLRLFGARFRLVGRAVVEVAIAPLRALWRGDVSALQFLILRGVARLLLYFRICSVVNELTTRINEMKLRRFGQFGPGFDPKWYERRVSLLIQLKGIAGERLGFAVLKSIAGATGLFTVLKLGYQAIPKEWISSMSDWAHRFLRLSSGGGQGQRGEHMIDIGEMAIASAVAYALWIIVTNFIVMRNLLIKRGTYDMEKSVFDAMGGVRPLEIPIDILGIAVMLLTMISVIWLGIQKTQIVPGEFVSALGFYTFVAILLISVALWRRRKRT